MKIFTHETEDWKSLINNIKLQPNLKPFSDEVILFITDFSDKILSNSEYRKYPELISLAFWFRRAKIEFLKKETSHDLPRGLVFHIAPSNIDTIFLYSCFLSMLAGNKNIIRISQKQSELINTIINLINESKYKEILKTFCILTYDHDDEVNKFINNACDMRVVWGGDNTIKEFRSKYPLNPLATELAFPNRFSMSAIKVLEISKDNINNLVKKFCNDSFMFSQQACSSPKVIVWIGEGKDVIDLFWERVRGYEGLKNTAVMLQDRFVSMTEMACRIPDGLRLNGEITDFPLRLVTDNLNDSIRDYHCGNGMFVEIYLNRLSDLKLSDKDQTLSYFGFSKEELGEFVGSINNRAIDRIVPIGESLEFNSVWDGVNLLTSFMRKVFIK